LAAKIAQALGATPVTMPKGDTYDALSRGIVEATLGAPNDILGWKLSEVCKYCTLYSPAGYTAAFATVINKNKWNSFPADIQKVFTDVSEEWVEHTGEVWNKGEVEAFEFSKKKGEDRFIFLSAQEGARWDKALEPIFEDYKKAMQAKGLPGEEALKYRQQLIEKYSKKYPPLRAN
jgi:TRAP-type C4-dicarboxylate transport system substrate-binding protein